MKKSVIVGLHLGYWGCFVLMIMAIIAAVYGAKGDEAMADVENTFLALFYFAFVPSVISFYAFYLFLFPRYLEKRKFIFAAIIGLAIGLCSALIGYLLLVNGIESSCIAEEGNETIFGVISFMTFVALVSGVIAMVIKGFIKWFEEIKLKEALQEKNHAMEMALVKAQLDPHFLFNTLNNIDVLIIKDAEEASSYLNKLSDIMRFMLFETKADEIPLAQEIEYIQKYIELQKIRTANKNYISFSVQGHVGEKRIAPMVFIPFIENAFKHTTNKKLDQAITVDIQIEENVTRLICINRIDSNRILKQKHNGLGNDLIKRRLNLIYPNRHHLEVKNEEGKYSVYLTIENE